MPQQGKNVDGSRIVAISVIIIAISLVCFFIGKSQMAAYMRSAEYDYDRFIYGLAGVEYYMPGEQMQNVSIVGMIVGAIGIVCGIVQSKQQRKASVDMLSGVTNNVHQAAMKPTAQATGTRKCSSCGQFYPNNRSSCPHCGGR